MADNYLQPVNDHFSDKYTFDDVDDDTFLSNSRTNSIPSTQGGNVATGSLSGSSTNPFTESSQQMYAEKRRQIERRTLESTQNSLGLLYKTEEVGRATAEELAKQREQLDRTNRQLDDINSSLRFSQRHLNSLKSVFGGLKNYLAGNRESGQNVSTMPQSPSGSHMSAATMQNGKVSHAETIAAGHVSVSAPISPTERYDNHPISRIRGDSTLHQQRMQQQQDRQHNPFDQQLENNLEEMCSNLSRLKCLATDLGTEIESQNELLDNMNYKIEDVDIKMNKQNREINKLMKR